ncbi:hypothetical protein N9N15_00290 [Flavobacteriaceae bacterium]|nr:hypothetical protein [Flavobacteriaceae bacterium]
MKNLALKYSVEFIVIVLGISISFYVENYSENKKKDDLKNQSLNRIFQNIEFDIGDNIFNYKIHNGALNSAYWLIKNKKKLSNFSRDTIGYYFSKAIDEVTYFVDNQEEYRTLQNSGYMELIDNEELVKNLQEKYSSHNFMKTIEVQIIERSKKLMEFQFINSTIMNDSIKGVYSFNKRFTGSLNVPNNIFERIIEKASFDKFYSKLIERRLKNDSLILKQIKKEITSL